MKLRLLLVFLVLLLSMGYVSGITQIELELDTTPDWKIYALNEEANKDKLYCRTTRVNGDVIETRWYNSFINPNEVVRVDKGDTTTPNCEYPQHEPVYAVGSNKGKVYSRLVFDEEGNVIETIWHDACSDEIIRSDEGDTTYEGSNEFTGECYHPDYAINNGEEVEEKIEKDIPVTAAPIIEFGNKIINWFRSLLGI